MTVFRSSILILISTAALSPGLFGDEAKEFKTQPRPMDLAELLRVLPVCPDKWEMKRSNARRQYTGHLEAYAVREYEKIPSLKNREKHPPPKPENVSVVIRDTCGLGSHLEPFRKETAPAAGGDFMIGKWKQYPAVMVRLGNERKTLRVLISNRFVIELFFSGDNPKALNLWMKHCNLRALAQAKNRTPMIIGKKVALRFLDELHPDWDRSYVVPVVHDKTDIAK